MKFGLNLEIGQAFYLQDYEGSSPFLCKIKKELTILIRILIAFVLYFLFYTVENVFSFYKAECTFRIHSNIFYISTNQLVDEK